MPADVGQAALQQPTMTFSLRFCGIDSNVSTDAEIS